MIISCSRRTDVPAFYSEWFMNRIRAGFCEVQNPFRKDPVTTVSLKPEDVDVIVFWTRNPEPIIKHLKELDKRGYRYYFQYTIMNNPRLLDPGTPAMDKAIATARQLADAVGADRLIWRYDPIVFGTGMDATFHRNTYDHIAGALRRTTHRSVISIVDVYRKVERRLRGLAEKGFQLQPCEGKQFENLMISLAQIAKAAGMEIFSCAEEKDFSPYGIKPGKCIDDEYIRKVFSVEVSHKKDPSQRKACGCVESRDIGAYNTCLFGCEYCYATDDFKRAKSAHTRHNPASAALLP
jgi:hypothetical protein